MKAIIDENLCIACGLCAETCPEVFELGEDGDVSQVKVDIVPEELEELCKQAAEGCPVEAITLED